MKNKNSTNIKLLTVFLLCIGISFIDSQVIYSQSISQKWYVDNAATGANNGTSWTNAWQGFVDISWASISPGDVIYISGGFSSKTYTERLLINAVNGSSDSPVIIKVGQDAGHNGDVIITNNGPYAGIFIQNSTYVTIDGNVNGVQKMKIQNCTVTGVQIYEGTSHHIKLTYLDVYNNGNQSDEDGIVVRCAGEIYPNVEISYCKIHKNWQDQLKGYGGGHPASGFGAIIVHHNEIYDVHDDGFESGAGGIDFYDNEMFGRAFGGGAGHPDGLQFYGEYYRIYNNKFHDFHTGNAYIYIEVGTGRAAESIYIYNNLIYETEVVRRGIVSPYDFWKAIYPTEGLFDLEADANALVANLRENNYIDIAGFIQESFYQLGSYSEMILDDRYDSILEQIYNRTKSRENVGPALRGIECGFHNSASSPYISNYVIANNVIVNMPTQGIGISFYNFDIPNISNITIANNVVHNCYTNGGGVAFSIRDVVNNNLIGNAGSGAEIIFDHNILSRGANGSNYFYYDDTWGVTQEQLVNNYHLNIHGINADPSLNAEYKPDDINDPVVDNGMDLSDYFNFDLDSIIRPQGPQWDIGAYEFIYEFEDIVTPGIQKNDGNLSIFPNPASSFLIIESEINTIKLIEIFTLSGVKVMQQKINTAKQLIDISQIPSGMYVYKIHETNNKSNSGKLVINR